jgi:hypothetical protein
MAKKKNKHKRHTPMFSRSPIQPIIFNGFERSFKLAKEADGESNELLRQLESLLCAELSETDISANSTVVSSAKYFHEVI